MEKIGSERKTPERQRTPIEKVREYLALEQIKLAGRLEKLQSGLPEKQRLTVAPDFRIVPPKDSYDAADKQLAEHITKQHYGSSEEEIQKKENGRAGPALEMLKTAIMHKHMGERFIVVRASRYDDYVNGVDNVLADTATGHTICALDQVSNSKYRSPEIMDKTKKVLGRNFGLSWENIDDLDEPSGAVRSPKVAEHGASLKYGIELKGAAAQCRAVNHLPIFMLSLSHEDLDEAEHEFTGGETGSTAEKRVFKYFLTMLYAQIQQIKLKPRHYETLPGDLRERVDSFQKFIEETLHIQPHTKT